MEGFHIIVALLNRYIKYSKFINNLNEDFYLLFVVGTPTTEITPT